MISWCWLTVLAQAIWHVPVADVQLNPLVPVRTYSYRCERSRGLKRLHGVLARGNCTITLVTLTFWSSVSHVYDHAYAGMCSQMY